MTIPQPKPINLRKEYLPSLVANRTVAYYALGFTRMENEQLEKQVRSFLRLSHEMEWIEN